MEAVMNCALKQNVAVIGAAGNIGSELTLFLISEGLNVTAFDEDPRLPSDILQIIKLNSQDIETAQLQSFDVVIFLGGCTGRSACSKLSFEERYKRNVLDVINLVQRMNSNQHFITVSTSAISEGMENAKENDTILQSLLDDYTTVMYQRELKLREHQNNSSSCPRISVFRLGTVVGVSVGQRTDLLVPQLFKYAYHEREIPITTPLLLRSFLWLQDLNRAFYAVIESSIQREKIERFNIWNLASFDATVLQVAMTITSLTNTALHLTSEKNDSTDIPLMGFSVNCLSFKEQFDFVFNGTLTSVLSEFNDHVPDSITAKGIHRDSIPCPVCGSLNQKIVLDLGQQPFANSFRKSSTEALELQRFPLQLVWCKHCNHFHLSNVASREDLFSNYLYQSGTSKTLDMYFDWMAQKIIQESGSNKQGVVFEIGCNDGSQLDHFKKMDWITYGVDPASNLVPLATAKGHLVKVGFWGKNFSFPELPTGNNLNAIVVQNVLAHTADPVQFLKDCASIMSEHTYLYIQTSQCNMHEFGQFDTAYHEHISFFSAHSFLKAATLAGLYISSFETTPIHGTSCLVTMKIPHNTTCFNDHCDSLKHRLDYEIDLGITTELFYTNFASTAHEIKEWLLHTIEDLKSNSYTIGAYGAAAKGMTLMHFLLHNNYNKDVNLFDFVLDDAPLKQNMFCPGTSIPVYPVQYINQLDDQKPLALIILAWNFWEEIAEKLKSVVSGKREHILAVLPFPQPHVITVQLKDDFIKYDL